MSEESVEKATSQSRPSSVLAVVVGAGIVLATALIIVFQARPRPVSRIVCAARLRAVGLQLLTYSDEHGEFPPAGKWCDVLADQYSRRMGKSPGEFQMSLHCPKVDRDDWGYAINSLANHGAAQMLSCYSRPMQAGTFRAVQNYLRRNAIPANGAACSSETDVLNSSSKKRL